MTLFLNFREKRVSGGTLKTPQVFEGTPASGFKLMEAKRFADMAAGRDILVATHGYDNNWSDGTYALSRLEQSLLPNTVPANTLYAAVLWPGDSYAWKLGYPSERRTAVTCGRNLAAFLNLSAKHAASLSFASHSLGARVVLEAARHVTLPVRLMCLMAAAIENTCLYEEYADVAARAETIAVLSSRSDNVLRWAFPAGNLVSAVLNPTANPLSSALGYAGPRSPIGKSTRAYPIGKAFDYDHGDYLPSGAPGGVFPTPPGAWARPSLFIANELRKAAQSWP
jgi:hypothetical protein